MREYQIRYAGDPNLWTPPWTETETLRGQSNATCRVITILAVGEVATLQGGEWQDTILNCPVSGAIEIRRVA